MTSNASRDAVVCHLEDILASPTFARSKRLAAFLSWVVNQSLAGDAASIAERNIALRVYQRAKDFDAKIDGIIRVEAMRLRHKLREYYELAPTDRRIEIPKGSYSPVFCRLRRRSSASVGASD
jgi:adenylate cyclase